MTARYSIIIIIVVNNNDNINNSIVIYTMSVYTRHKNLVLYCTKTPEFEFKRDDRRSAKPSNERTSVRINLNCV